MLLTSNNKEVIMNQIYESIIRSAIKTIDLGLKVKNNYLPDLGNKITELVSNNQQLVVVGTLSALTAFCYYNVIKK